MILDLERFNETIGSCFALTLVICVLYFSYCGAVSFWKPNRSSISRVAAGVSASIAIILVCILFSYAQQTKSVGAIVLLIFFALVFGLLLLATLNTKSCDADTCGVRNVNLRTTIYLSVCSIVLLLCIAQQLIPYAPSFGLSAATAVILFAGSTALLRAGCGKKAAKLVNIEHVISVAYLSSLVTVLTILAISTFNIYPAHDFQYGSQRARWQNNESDETDQILNRSARMSEEIFGQEQKLRCDTIELLLSKIHPKLPLVNSGKGELTSVTADQNCLTVSYNSTLYYKVNKTAKVSELKSAIDRMSRLEFSKGCSKGKNSMAEIGIGTIYNFSDAEGEFIGTAGPFYSEDCPNAPRS